MTILQRTAIRNAALAAAETVAFLTMWTGFAGLVFVIHAATH
jgi:hypothetical protein